MWQRAVGTGSTAMSDRPLRILLVRLSALGDVAVGLHILSTLRARFPSAHLGWLIEDRFASLVEAHPELDSTHIYARKGLRFPWNWWRIPGFLHSVRRERYDVALDLQGNLKSGVLAALAGAKRRAGLGGSMSREGNRWFVRERIEPPVLPHRLDAYHALVDAVFLPGPRAFARLEPGAEQHGAIVLHGGTSRFGAFKRWPPERFADLGDRLATRLRAPVWLTAGPGERAQVEAVRARMRTEARIVEPADLPSLVRVLAGARVVVAGDTGPAHLAAATGVATVVLFGPKDPAVHAPAGARVATVRNGVRCSPCSLRACPAPVCMTELDVDPVEAAALELCS